MAYATRADLENALDVRKVAQLSSDSDGTVVTAVVSDALDRASGEILTAAQAGGVYTSADLDALASASDPGLRHLTVTLATRNLWQRRGADIPSGVQSAADAVIDVLDQLRAGRRVLNVPGATSNQLPTAYDVPEARRSTIMPASSSRLFPPLRRSTP